MGEQLPYLVSPGTVDTGLEKVRTASEPTELTATNVGEQLGIKGGTGATFVRLLKKLNFLGEGGRPTDLYRRFRGEKGRSQALAEGMRNAYAPIFRRVQKADTLNREDLAALVTEITGASADSKTVDLTVSTFQRLCKYAGFGEPGPVANKLESAPVAPELPASVSPGLTSGAPSGRSVTLAHNIHLNLPDTTDIRVFDAIFRSLRENLLV
jgi:hypothetical protein